MTDLNCSICKELGETCSECQPTVDVPPATGHAIPMWLRFHFDELELHATRMSGASVFTQMRTKVQAYFEMLRSAELGNAGRELFITGRAAELDTPPSKQCEHGIRINQSCFDCISKLHGAKS